MEHLEEVIGIYFLSRSGCGVLHGPEGRHTLEDNTTKEAIRKKRRKRLKELNCTRDVPNISESEKPSYSLVSI